MEVENKKPANRKPYEAPEIEDWGSVADLTETGNTHPGGDAKGGSVTHSMGH